LRFLRHVSARTENSLASPARGWRCLGDELGGSLNAARRIGAIMEAAAASCRNDRGPDRTVAYARTPPSRPPRHCAGRGARRCAGASPLALDARGIQVDTRLTAATVRAYRSQLGNVLDNLLSNAVKFIPKAGAFW